MSGQEIVSGIRRANNNLAQVRAALDAMLANNHYLSVEEYAAIAQGIAELAQWEAKIDTQLSHHRRLLVAAP